MCYGIFPWVKGNTNKRTLRNQKKFFESLSFFSFTTIFPKSKSCKTGPWGVLNVFGLVYQITPLVSLKV